MEWTIIDSDVTQQDPSGVEGFIQRMDRELKSGGPPLEGFKFLNSGPEMLRITREIENEALAREGDGDTLYVGFQTAEKLHIETDRYRRMNQSGVTAVGFGHGQATDEGVQTLEQWVDLPHDTRAFENQWYLVTRGPVPILFIGWETSAPEMFGQGGISTPGKHFKGFVSSDLRVVEAAIGHLERVRQQQGPVQAMPLDQLADQIPFPVRRMMIVTDDGQNHHLAELRQAGTQFAAKKSASVLLYDLSAASYLVSPYPSAEYEREFNRAIDKKELGIIGRHYLVNQLEELEAQGLSSGVVLPTGHGFTQLAQRAEGENVDLIMIPSSLVRPGLFDRIKGYTLKVLIDHTSIPVLVYQEGGTAWLRTRASRNPAQSQGMNPGSQISREETVLNSVAEPA